MANSSLAQISVSRLRSEGVDVRLRNAHSSTIYPLQSIEVQIEVPASQVEQANQLLKELENSFVNQNLELDFTEYDEEDIAFEKEVHEREMKILNSKPQSLIYLLIALLAIIAVMLFSFSKEVN